MRLLAVMLASMATAIPAIGAETVKVKMLTNGSDGQMRVFEPALVRVAVGDTIDFLPIDRAGHTSVSIFWPDGATPWHAKPDAELKVKIEKPGIYLVVCEAHETMGMVAVIVAGAPVNLEEARKRARQESKKMLINKDRFERLLAEVK